MQGPSHHGLGDCCVWLAEIDDQVVPIPSVRSKSALDAIVQNLSAAVCFGSRGTRTTSVRPRKDNPVSGGRSGRTGDKQKAHVITIRSRSGSTGVKTGPSSGRSPTVRRGHWRHQPYGPHSNPHYKWIWIFPTFVNGCAPTDTPETIYRLPRLKKLRR